MYLSNGIMARAAVPSGASTGNIIHLSIYSFIQLFS